MYTGMRLMPLEIHNLGVSTLDTTYDNATFNAIKLVKTHSCIHVTAHTQKTKILSQAYMHTTCTQSYAFIHRQANTCVHKPYVKSCDCTNLSSVETSAKTINRSAASPFNQMIS